MHDDEQPAHKSGGDPQPSKAALKQKKKREARKAKKQEDGDSPESPVKNGPPVVSNVKVTLTGDAEKDKKIRNIKKVRCEIIKICDCDVFVLETGCN